MVTSFDHPLSFYISVGHQHLKDVTIIQIQSSTSTKRQEFSSCTGRTISTLGRGSSMIVRIGEPKRVGGRGVDLNYTIILDPGFF